MPARRTILSFFLLCLFAAPLLLLSVLQIRQVWVRHTLEERLEEQLLKTLVVSKQAWKRLNNREILVDGRMFDLETVTETANGYIVTGVFDDEETGIVQQLTKAGAQQSKNESPLFVKFFQLQQQAFFQDNEPVIFATFLPAKLFHFPIPYLLHPCKPVLSPPPQLAA